MKRMASERKNSSSKSRSRFNKRVSLAAGSSKTSASKQATAASRERHYAVCVRNDGYPASLELRKLYPLLEDSFAAEHGMVRVIDESGEDYLYPNDFFVKIDLPSAVEKTLARIA